MWYHWVIVVVLVFRAAFFAYTFFAVPFPSIFSRIGVFLSVIFDITIAYIVYYARSVPMIGGRR